MDRAGRRRRCDERVDVVSSGGGVGRQDLIVRLPRCDSCASREEKILQMGPVTAPGYTMKSGAVVE
jgi:hypothetical protein